MKVAQSCPTLWDSVDYTVHGILEARILEWVSLSLLQGIFSIQGSNPGLQHCRWILYQLSHKKLWTKSQEPWGVALALSLWNWARHLTSIGHHLLICKMGMILSKHYLSPHLSLPPTCHHPCGCSSSVPTFWRDCFLLSCFSISRSPLSSRHAYTQPRGFPFPQASPFWLRAINPRYLGIQDNGGCHGMRLVQAALRSHLCSVASPSSMGTAWNANKSLACNLCSQHTGWPFMVLTGTCSGASLSRLEFSFCSP